MAIRKRNDNEGWRCGNGAYSDNSAGLVRGSGFNYGGPGASKSCGVYQDADANFLTNKMPDEATAPASRYIGDAVEGQSSDSGNRAVKSRGQP